MDRSMDPGMINRQKNPLCQPTPLVICECRILCINQPILQADSALTIDVDGNMLFKHGHFLMRIREMTNLKNTLPSPKENYRIKRKMKCPYL